MKERNVQIGTSEKTSGKEYAKSGFVNENNVSNVESVVATLSQFFLLQHA